MRHYANALDKEMNQSIKWHNLLYTFAAIITLMFWSWPLLFALFLTDSHFIPEFQWMMEFSLFLVCPIVGAALALCRNMWGRFLLVLPFFMLIAGAMFGNNPLALAFPIVINFGVVFLPPPDQESSEKCLTSP